MMIDGSHLPFEENIAVTREVVEKARPAGVSVEGELGKLAGIEDNVSVSEQDAIFTDSGEATEFVEKTGVDSLAVAVGTSDGQAQRDRFRRSSPDRPARSLRCEPGTCGDRQRVRGEDRRC